MCETELCKEILNTILNGYIPQILPTLHNYVVKGGRASDFYISQSTGQMLFGFTDWDLACDSKETQETIENTIKSYLSQRGIRNIQSQQIITQDSKPGKQLGIKCDEEKCFFIDIVIYGSSDPIFNSPSIDNGINYININYLFDDLKQTNTDRTERLSQELSDFNIVDIDVYNLTDNINLYMDNIQQQLTKSITDKGLDDIKKIESNIKISPKRKVEYIEEIKEQIANNIASIISELLPKIKTNIQKLLRTNYRLQKISEIIGQQTAGRKRKTIKKRTNNKTFKRKTIKNMPNLPYQP